MIDRKTALLHAQIYSYKALVNKTKGFISWALKKVKKPYVACSFGKDSAVMLHLVLSVDPDIDVRFVRWEGETEHIDNYDEVIKEWGLKNLTQVYLNRLLLEDKRKDRFDADGYDSFFVGLRTEESTARRITLKKLGMFYFNSDSMYRICPLADWKTDDIATYVLSNSLPTLGSYIQHGFESRTAARIPRADFGIRNQFLTDLKQRDFDSYQKILQKFPEIKL